MEKELIEDKGVNSYFYLMKKATEPLSVCRDIHKLEDIPTGENR
ncbi:hypothetical protein RV11_GL000201 [Enterococcus phoeniculicola]|jgi:hypothetical protein|uniref:Uncharacterized protein n=1 Tax=Enterococcus phoeniculicola ATCC BAA-412 TaxID=1158610 RepID=R3WD22_9ENTE|nr:hypothetical protein [Enterococcus phoeniculicola]EOL45367.1 hypothetical protein UC3_01257 [Enterococcus phoeniculicola ATCC BAA-412]EOT74729.1 hypothetical protein I589_02329 [Enterococcus phoeniculicola ATCC BAA-412]OJG73835.1 hypothetical protein RV11_GL000201 [Enterococcus phoeniculicola]